MKIIVAPARVDAGDMVKRWPDAGCILKEELTGLADVLHVGEKEPRMIPSLDAWKNGVVSLPKWVKCGREVLNRETRSLFLDLLGLRCHSDIQEEMSRR